MTAAERQLPTTLRWAVRLLVAEAAAVALVASFLLYQDLTAAVSDTGAAIAVTGYAAVMAGVLALLAVNLGRRRAWPRGLAIALQLLLLPVAYYMIMGGLAWLGVPIGALGLVVIGLLLTPATREALGIR